MVVTNTDLNRELGEIKQLVKDFKDENKSDHRRFDRHFEKLNGKVEINTKKSNRHETIFKIFGGVITSSLFIYSVTILVPLLISR